MVEWLRRFRWRRLLLDVAIVAGVVAAVGAWQSRNLRGAGPAPALTGPTLAGGALDLSSLHGRKTVVAFWAPWCGVCKLEMPTLNALAKDGVQVIGVALGYPDVAAVERFAREHQLAFPTVLGDERIRRDWAVEVFPTLYVIDEQGRIEHAMVGYTTGLGLRLRLF